MSFFIGLLGWQSRNTEADIQTALALAIGAKHSGVFALARLAHNKRHMQREVILLFCRRLLVRSGRGRGSVLIVRHSELPCLLRP